MKAPLCKIILSILAVTSSDFAFAETGQEGELHELASCVVKRDAEAAYHFVETPPQYETPKSKRRFDHVFSKCYKSNVMLGFDGYNLAFDIADLLVNRDYREGGVDFSNVPPLEWAKLDVSPENRIDDKSELKRQYEYYNALSNFAECSVRASSRQALAVLKSSKGSDDEAQELAGMQDAFSGCLPVGTVKLDRAAVRGAMALAYIRLARIQERSAS